MPTVKELYETWCAQPDNQARNKLLLYALGANVNGISEIPEYCDSLKDANQAVSKAWGNVEEESAPRYSCQIGETAEEGKRECVVEWWPDDDTHIVTPRFATEAEAKAFAAYLFASLESA